jgi:hypothetical protein
MAQRVNIEQLSPQELYQIKQGFEGEITTLGQSMNQLRFALDKYEEGKRSIKAVEECKEDEELLMPLSHSLYIQGYLNNRVNQSNPRPTQARSTSSSTEPASSSNAPPRSQSTSTTARSASSRNASPNCRRSSRRSEKDSAAWRYACSRSSSSRDSPSANDCQYRLA